jgi:hypothetical protein
MHINGRPRSTPAWFPSKEAIRESARSTLELVVKVTGWLESRSKQQECRSPQGKLAGKAGTTLR